MSGESDAGGASAPTDPDAPAGGDFAALAPDLTRRIGSILDAVQREADKMLAEARREAQQQIELGRRRQMARSPATSDGLLSYPTP